MSLHSYSRVWVHLVWATLERRPLLTKAAAAKLSTHLTDYAAEKEIYMKINFVNPDPVHALGGPADEPFCRRDEAALQGPFLTLDQSKCIGSYS